MSAWILVEVVMFLVLSIAMAALWMRLQRPAKDDPRLSKGLQLLQSKIAVLEDLADRTELQVEQMTTLMAQKNKELHQKIQQADREIHRIEQATQKSLEVAEIFQDKIPHQEIVERQNTLKHIKAARLAHQGLSAEEIRKQVDLSMGEIEFIARVNKDQLVFSEEDLPQWAKQESVTAPPTETLALDSVFEMPAKDEEALKKLGEAFRQANVSLVDTAPSPPKTETPEEAFDLVKPTSAPTAEQFQMKKVHVVSSQMGKSNSQKDIVVKPVAFRKIDLTKELS